MNLMVLKLNFLILKKVRKLRRYLNKLLILILKWIIVLIIIMIIFLFIIHYLKKFPSNIIATFCKYEEKLFFDRKNMNDDDYEDFKL